MKAQLLLCLTLIGLTLSAQEIAPKQFLPSYGPVVQDGVDASLEVSYIYWRVSEDGLISSSQGYNLTNKSSFNVIEPQGEQQGIFDRCSSGFKAGFGADFKYDDWFIDVLYTYFHSNYNPLKNHQENGETLESQGPYFTTIPGYFDTKSPLVVKPQPLFFNNMAAQALSFWNLRFNVIDCMLNKSFYLSRYLIVTPALGIKTTWQNQSYTARYWIEGLSSKNQTTLENYRTFNKQFYAGVGTRLGLDTAWFVSDELSLFAQIFGTTLFGVFKDKREDITAVAVKDTGEVLVENNMKVNVRAVEHFVNTVLETQIGLRWDYYLFEEAYRLRLQFGYENQLWFNQNHFLTPNLGGAQGADLGFMGFNFTVKFDF